VNIAITKCYNKSGVTNTFTNVFIIFLYIYIYIYVINLSLTNQWLLTNDGFVSFKFPKLMSDLKCKDAFQFIG
jgi:hypothetical protein